MTMETPFTALKEAKKLRGTALVHEVDLVPKGHTRIQTGFFYPDGSSVDLFIERENGLLAGLEPVKLTDFGNTFSWLGQVGVDPQKSPRRREIVKDVLTTYDVREAGGALELRVPRADLATGIVRLGQACLRIADIVYTLRVPSVSQFSEEMEEFLGEAGLDYESGAQISVRDDVNVKVDFRVRGVRAESAVMLLSAETKVAHYAKQKAEHVFVVFSDLGEWSGQRITAFDDRTDIYANADIRRLDKCSTVVPFSDRDSLRSLLQAA
jgi:hypothetical protein